MQSAHLLIGPSPTKKDSTASPRHKFHSSPFITKPKEVSSEVLIAEHYAQLHQYIDALKPKMQRMVEYNEAEVLLAYRNMFNTIREEI